MTINVTEPPAYGVLNKQKQYYVKCVDAQFLEFKVKGIRGREGITGALQTVGQNNVKQKPQKGKLLS